MCAWIWSVYCFVIFLVLGDSNDIFIDILENDLHEFVIANKVALTENEKIGHYQTTIKYDEARRTCIIPASSHLPQWTDVANYPVQQGDMASFITTMSTFYPFVIMGILIMITWLVMISCKWCWIYWPGAMLNQDIVNPTQDGILFVVDISINCSFFICCGLQPRWFISIHYKHARS